MLPKQAISCSRNERDVKNCLVLVIYDKIECLCHVVCIIYNSLAFSRSTEFAEHISWLFVFLNVDHEANSSCIIRQRDSVRGCRLETDR